MISRIGGALGSLVGVFEYAQMIFGIVSFVGSALCFFVPESKGKPLKEEIDEILLSKQNEKSNINDTPTAMNTSSEFTH